MRAEDYLRIATGDIADPARACDAYRELKSHLEQATADVAAQGVEPTTAEQVAMARMGAPESLALSLAAAHHGHIPWRHYVAVLPLSCLVMGTLTWGEGWLGTIGQHWLALLIVCAVPGWATLRKWIRSLEIDLNAKRQWLQAQPLRAAVRSGGAAGFVTGTLVWAIPAALDNPFFVFLIAPPLVAVPFLYRLYRANTAPARLTAACAALAFPVGALPLLLRYDGPIDWLFTSVTFGVLVMGAGWLAQTVKRISGWFIHT